MKTTEEIYEEMKTRFSEGTGLALKDGGDMALRLYAAAAQLSSLWIQTDYVLRQSFPQTAEGGYLDYHAQIRGLNRASATKAAGTIRFYIASVLPGDLSIASGVSCMTAAETGFITTEAGVITAGELYCDVAAEALEAGEGGNVPALSVIYMTLAPAGVYSCSNPEAFSAGAAAESDDSLRERILASYKTLPNGANAAYYEAQARDTDGVAAVCVLPKNRGLGTVDVVIAAADGMPGEPLISAVQEKLDAQREICVDIEVAAPTCAGVVVEVSVKAGDGYDYDGVAAAVEAALTAWFTGERLGEDVLLVRLGSIIYATEGVKNYSIISPAADVAVDPDELPVLDSLTITEMA
ncbi:MAG: phage tail protein [Clostridia bacterium]|nr:phage tail protein [Clostridia bacterium]